MEKGKLTVANRDAAWSRLQFTTELSDLADRHLVIEAIVEDIAAKNELFATLDGLCGPETVFASNTSSLTITDMAAASGRPERVVGLHFFNPVPVMELVEVVRTIATSDEVFRAAYAFTEALGKKPIAAKDNSGFVVNLLLVPLYAGCDPPARARCGLDGGHRSSDDTGIGAPHGSVYAV